MRCVDRPELARAAFVRSRHDFPRDYSNDKDLAIAITFLLVLLTVLLILDAMISYSFDLASSTQMYGYRVTE